MLISRLQLQNWRNFKKIEVDLRDRVFVIGPNASGKSNLLDVFRFLRDVAKPKGGGLQRAVEMRGGMTKVRCLLARSNPEVLIEVDLAEKIDTPAIWRYCLAFRSEGKGKQRVVVSKERVEDLRTGAVLLDRPHNPEDQADRERLTETSMEQVNANKDFRDIAQFFGALTYLHLVPQLLKHTELGASALLEGDPFGQSFLERIAKTPDRTLTLRTRQDGDWAVIAIEDNGPGMDEDTRRRVFEPFFTTKEPGHGTGLGLYVSYLIVRDNHGGDLLVESAPGKGAAFHIRLPLHVPPRKDVRS